ncbi:MAG: ABC transporter permease [Nitrospinota bacterium]
MPLRLGARRSNPGLGAAAGTAAPAPARGVAYGWLNPESLVMSGALGMLAVLAILPVAVYVSSSFRHYTEAGPVGITLANYVSTFSEPIMREAIWNTFFIAGATALCAGVLGTALAWFHARTDMPGRALLEPLTLVPFFLSSFVGAIAWWALAAPRIGMLNHWAIRLFGLSGPPFNIYSMGGIILVLSLFYTPYMYLFTIGSFHRMDPALEETARICGTGVIRTALRVTIPLATPAILSGAIIIFVVSASVFGVPIALGGPSRIHTLSTQIFTKMEEYPLDVGGAAAAGSILMLVTALGIAIQRRIIAPRSYVTVTGKGYRPQRVSLGGGRYVALGVNLAYILLAVVLPLGALALASLSKLWLGSFQWEQLTLQNWRFVLFEYEYTIRAIRNSLLLGIVGGFLTVVLCTLLAYLIIRGRRGRLRGVLDYLSTLPVGVPGIVMGMAFLVTWIRTPLWGFPLILLMLAYMTRYMPYGLRTVSAVLQALSPELEESSRVCGASLLRTLRRVTVPLLHSGMAAAYLMLFIMFIRELPVSILLATEQSTPMAVALYVIRENETLGVVAAFALVQTLLLLGGTYIFRRLAGLEELAV